MKNMDYTCKNCEFRFAWYCEERGSNRKCDYFTLDENTISEREREFIRAFKYVVENR